MAGNYGLFSILPPIIAILLAVKTKNLLVSLFLAGYVGVLTLSGGNPILALFYYIKDFIYVQAAQSGNANSLVAMIFIGSFVALLTQSGGSAALAKKMVHLLDTRCKAQLAVWVSGLIIFFTDSGNSLIVGPAFQAVTDRLNVSREKLSYILDCTSSPICILIPFIGWGIFIMGLMQKEFEALRIPYEDYSAFLHVIPYQFYAIGTLLMVPLVAITGYEFSAMYKAEKRMIETGLSSSAASAESTDKAVYAGDKATPSIAVIPMVILFGCLFGLLIYHGFPFKNVKGDVLRASLGCGYFLGSLSAVILMIRKKIYGAGKCFDIFIGGAKDMMFIIIMLLLAWSLGAICKALGTASFIVSAMHGAVPAWIIPALVFTVGAIISFMTGSSWGTFSILIPLAVPMAHLLGAPMYATIGAVLSGGLFGDHCSPISDTTLLSSIGGACDHFAHVETQLPYALTVAAASLAGYIAAGFVESVLVLPFSIVLMAVFTVVLGKMFGEKLPSRIGQ